jgi:geranylgeranyl diphosphate synthase, type I
MTTTPTPRDRFKAFSKEHVPHIDRSIHEYLDMKKKGARLPIIGEMYGLLDEYCCREGKRVRPLIMLISCFGYQRGKKLEDAVNIASVIEMMHSFLLIQDDIIDRSSLRRGGETLHVSCGGLYGGYSHNRNIGNDIALVLADILFAGAVEIIARSSVPPGAKDRFLEIFANTYEVTAWGQILDILNSRSKKIDNPGDSAINVATMKTAYYTVYYPMLMGYVLAGRNADQEKELIRDFALPLGLAFQIRDDVLGVFGSKESTGKPSDSDIMEAKVTILVNSTIEKLGKKDRQKFLELFTKNRKTHRDVDTIRQMIDSSGSREAVVERHWELVEESRHLLSRLKLSEEYRETMTGLVEQIAKI